MKITNVGLNFSEFLFLLIYGDLVIDSDLKAFYAHITSGIWRGKYRRARCQQKNAKFLTGILVGIAATFA